MVSQTQLSLTEIQRELYKLHKVVKEATHSRDIAEVCHRSICMTIVFDLLLLLIFILLIIATTLLISIKWYTGESALCS